MDCVKKQPRGGDTGNGFDKRPEDINREGRPDAGFTWKELFIKKAQEKKGQLERRERVANAIWKKAETGDVPAFKEIRDTMDGKPMQPTDLTTGGQPFSVNVTNFSGASGALPVQSPVVPASTL